MIARTRPYTAVVALGVPLICLYLLLLAIAIGYGIIGAAVFAVVVLVAWKLGFFNPDGLAAVCLGRTLWFTEGRLHYRPVLGRSAFSADRADITAFVEKGERFIDVHLVEGPMRRIECGHLTVDRDCLIAELRALRSHTPAGAQAIA